MNPKSDDFCFLSHCEKGQNVGCGDEGTASIANDAVCAEPTSAGNASSFDVAQDRPSDFARDKLIPVYQTTRHRFLKTNWSTA